MLPPSVSNWGRFCLVHFYVKLYDTRDVSYLDIFKIHIKMSQTETSPIGHYFNKLLILIEIDISNSLLIFS